ncbi:MAG: CBS domain-containing protein [Armatimonadota bacterium]|jgi:CBS domain-containing protein/sporulation protein YlmC with PRC-barrel domain
MIFYAEAYLSDLMRMNVLDRDGAVVGRLRDVAVRLGDVFPLVAKLVIRRRGQRQPYVLPWDDVRSVSSESVTLLRRAGELQPTQLDPDDVLLSAAILDRQIVDVQGHRVVRVNDLKLGSVQGQVRLVAAGVGTRSLLRRLNLEGLALRVWSWFGKRPHEHLISWEHVHAVEPSSQQLRLGLEREKLQRLNPADLADILGEMNALDRAAVVSSLDEETAAAAMQEMDFDVQKSVLDSVESEKAADLLEEINPDDAADLVGDLPKDRADELLSLMEPDEASDVKELLKYPDDSAGGLMTTEYITVPAGMTAQEAIEYLRRVGEEAETIYYCYIVENGNRLAGVLSLRDLIVAPPNERIDNIMSRHLIAVQPLASQEETAHLISRYNLLAIPVLGEERKLLGIVTVDDAIDAVLPTRWKKRLPKVFSA